MKKVRKQHFGSTIKGKITIYAAISMIVMKMLKCITVVLDIILMYLQSKDYIC